MVSALLSASPVDFAAETLGFLFGSSRDEVKGSGQKRLSQNGTALRYILLHGLARQPDQPISPLGYDLTQDQIKHELGTTDRGLVKVGKSQIEAQITYPEPALAVSAIYEWIALGEAWRKRGRELATMLAREDIKPNPDAIGWRRSVVWQAIIALGRMLGLREPLAERDDWDWEDEADIEADNQFREATKKAAQSRTQARHAATKIKAAQTAAAAEKALQRVAKARAERADPILKMSQAALDTVCADLALQELLGRLEIAPPGAVALSGKPKVRAEKALRGEGLTVSLFFKAASKAMRKDVRRALSKLFPSCPISDHDYGEGKNACTRTDALLPAGA